MTKELKPFSSNIKKIEQVSYYLLVESLSFLACEESRDKLSASFTDNDRLTKCLPKWDGAACWPPVGEFPSNEMIFLIQPFRSTQQYYCK